MTYQIGDFVSQDRNQAILHLTEILKDNEETFRDFLREKFNDDSEKLLEVLINGDDETTSRFRNIFTTYCIEIAQDILAEEGEEGCFIM